MLQPKLSSFNLLGYENIRNVKIENAIDGNPSRSHNQIMECAVIVNACMEQIAFVFFL